MAGEGRIAIGKHPRAYAFGWPDVLERATDVDASVEPVGCLVRGDGKLATRTECNADETASRRDEFRLAIEIRQPVQSAAASQRVDDVQDPFGGRERQSLRATERRQ